MVAENTEIMDATFEQIKVLLEPSFLRSLFTLYLPKAEGSSFVKVEHELLSHSQANIVSLETLYASVCPWPHQPLPALRHAS